MNISDIKQNQVLTNGKNNYLVLKNDDNTLELFILNGFYTYILNKKNNTSSIKIEGDSETYKSDFLLFGYNLFYKNKEINHTLNLDELYVDSEYFDIKNKTELFSNFKKIFGAKIQNSFNKLKILNEVSKSYENYYNNKNYPLKYNVGDVYTDNLMKTDFFGIEDNELGLNNNYWIIVSVDKTERTAYAIHLEYLTIAKFNWIGQIEKILNDVDSRFGKCNSAIPKSPIFCGDYPSKKVYVNHLFDTEDVNKEHFFSGIKLINKIEFNKNQKEAIYHNLVAEVNYFSFLNPKVTNFFFRNYFNTLLVKYWNKKDKQLSSYYYDWDSSKNLKTIVYKHHIYESFVFDDFEEKISIIINNLLNLKTPKSNKNILNKEIIENSKNQVMKEYNNFFENVLKYVPEEISWKFKEEDSLENFKTYINILKKLKMKNLNEKFKLI